MATQQDLNEKRINALKELLSKRYEFENHTLTFSIPYGEKRSGIAKLKDGAFVSKAKFDVYIKDENVYATLHTLDMKKRIDAPIENYINKVKEYVIN